MMRSNKHMVLGLGSLLLVACGGAASGSDLVSGNATPAPAAAPSASGAHDTQSPSPASSADAGAAADALADAKSDPPLVKHCTGDRTEPDVCVENAQGRAGDVVDVDVVLLGNAACGDAWEASGRVAFDLTKLHLDNDVEQVACRTRHVSADPLGGDSVAWNAFGGGSLPGCAANVALGKVDTLRVKIDPSTPPGEYDLVWHDAAFVANASAAPTCTTVGRGISGKLRVLR